MNTKFYLFELEYGARTAHRRFLIEAMEKFNKRALTGISFFVNNNPYNLEFLVVFVFEKGDTLFDDWIKDNFPEYKYKFIFNYSLDDLIKNQFQNKRYNALLFSNAEQMDAVLSNESNEIFLFPEKKLLQKIWGGEPVEVTRFEVFLSHSSNDKILIDGIFSELQKSEIKVWYDKYEIDYGDSITDRINDGLKRSDLGLLCISKKFLSSNWAKSELNFFLQQRINKSNKEFIILNLDCEHQDLPPLIQDYRYLSLTNSEWKTDLLNTILRRKEKKTQ